MNFIKMSQPRGPWPQFSQTLCFCTRLVGESKEDCLGESDT